MASCPYRDVRGNTVPTRHIPAARPAGLTMAPAAAAAPGPRYIPATRPAAAAAPGPRYIPATRPAGSSRAPAAWAPPVLTPSSTNQWLETTPYMQAHANAIAAAMPPGARSSATRDIEAALQPQAAGAAPIAGVIAPIGPPRALRPHRTIDGPQPEEIPAPGTGLLVTGLEFGPGGQTYIHVAWPIVTSAWNRDPRFRLRLQVAPHVGSDRIQLMGGAHRVNDEV
jgi:hypothetical protein